jgi:hypothetical protein
MRAHGEITGCELGGRSGAWLVTHQPFSRACQSSATSDGISVGVVGFSIGLSEGNSDVRVGRHQPVIASELQCFETTTFRPPTPTHPKHPPTQQAP